MTKVNIVLVDVQKWRDICAELERRTSEALDNAFKGQMRELRAAPFLVPPLSYDLLEDEEEEQKPVTEEQTMQQELGRCLFQLFVLPRRYQWTLSDTERGYRCDIIDTYPDGVNWYRCGATLPDAIRGALAQLPKQKDWW